MPYNQETCVKRVLTFAISAFVLAAAVSSARRRSADAAKVYVGVLDDAREEMVNWKRGIASDRVIRPLFETTGYGWSLVDHSSAPPSMRWTIAFDGKNVGEVESAGVYQGLTPYEEIVGAEVSVPAIGTPSTKFAGLEGMTTKVRRPLVVVSHAYFRDPDDWRPTRVPRVIAGFVRNAFRRDFTQIDLCKDEEVLKHNWKFPDAALTFPSAYESNKHTFLIEANLNAGDCGYVNDPDDPLSDPWFYVSSNGAARHIGSFMTLLDAGDYDNTGHSEVVFFLSQPEDTDGFVLFDANFRKRVDAVWAYH
jgi:hypothetical protein